MFIARSCMHVCWHERGLDDLHFSTIDPRACHSEQIGKTNLHPQCQQPEWPCMKRKKEWSCMWWWFQQHTKAACSFIQADAYPFLSTIQIQEAAHIHETVA